MFRFAAADFRASAFFRFIAAATLPAPRFSLFYAFHHTTNIINVIMLFLPRCRAAAARFTRAAIYAMSAFFATMMLLPPL